MNRIRALREDRDLRQIDVAAATGIDQKTLSNYETGKTNPDSAAILKLADFFGVTADYLLGRTENNLVDAQSVINALDSAELFSILTANGWTAATFLAVILFTLFHWPCSTTCLTIKKEAGGVKWMLLGIAVPTAVGLIIVGIVNAIFSAFV